MRFLKPVTLLAPILLTLTGASFADQVERWTFESTIDFTNAPVKNQFVIKREGTVSVHALPRGEVRERHTRKTSLMKVVLSGKEVPTLFVQSQLGSMFKASRRLERSSWAAGQSTGQAAIQRVLTQQYADNVILEELGRLCTREWRAIRTAAKGRTPQSQSAIDWRWPALYRSLSFESTEEGGLRVITIRADGLGPQGGTGARRLTDFSFRGTLDAEGRFQSTLLKGVVHNETKKISQKISLQRTRQAPTAIPTQERVSYRRALQSLEGLVAQAAQGKGRSAADAWAKLALTPSAKRFQTTAREHFTESRAAAGGVAWNKVGLSSALDRARRSGQPVLVLFDQENCPPCMILKKRVLRSEEFARAARPVFPLNLNACTDAELAKRYKLRGTPTLLLLDHRGEVIAQQVGIKSLQQSLEFIQKGLKAFRPSTPGTQVWF